LLGKIQETLMSKDHVSRDTIPTIHRLRENLVYRNRFAAVYDDPVVFPDGSEGSHLRVVEADGKPGVAILAVCGKRVALVYVYRYPLATWEWAVPRGYAHDDDARRTAQAELVEELGREPDALTHIGTVTPNSGILASQVELFLAQYATISSQPKDREEIADVKWMDTETLYNHIANGQVRDTFTLSALMCALAHGLMDL
jgi:hypothetical protein